MPQHLFQEVLQRRRRRFEAWDRELGEASRAKGPISDEGDHAVDWERKRERSAAWRSTRTASPPARPPAGSTNKRFGRVGDSPIIGAGTYASNATCAVSATGHGEYFIRIGVARDIAAQMEYKGTPLAQAAESTLAKVAQLGGDGGVICIDRQANVALPFNTPGMYRAFRTSKGTEDVAIFGNK